MRRECSFTRTILRLSTCFLVRVGRVPGYVLGSFFFGARGEIIAAHSGTLLQAPIPIGGCEVAWPCARALRRLHQIIPSGPPLAALQAAPEASPEAVVRGTWAPKRSPPNRDACNPAGRPSKPRHGPNDESDTGTLGPLSLGLGAALVIPRPHLRRDSLGDAVGEREGCGQGGLCGVVEGAGGRAPAEARRGRLAGAPREWYTPISSRSEFSFQINAVRGNSAGPLLGTSTPLTC
jgi:hypothetical protein